MNSTQHFRIKYLFFISLFLLQPCFGFSEDKLVINILSENKELNLTLQKKLLKFKNKPFSKIMQSQIEDNIKKHLILNKYKNSEIRFTSSKKNKKIILNYKIIHPYRYHFILIGNKQIHRKKLYQLLKFKNTIYQKNFIESVLSQIRMYYQSLSFNDIKLKSKIKKNNKKFIHTVNIYITEGSRFILSRISISDTASPRRSHRLYMRLFRLYAADRIKRGYFIQKDFDRTMNKVVSHLRQLGFYSAKIQDTQIKLKKNKIFIKILIYQGPPTLISRIEIKGQKYFSKKKIKEILNLKKGAVINILQLEKNIENLISAYRKEGFFDAQITNKENIIQMAPQKDSIQVSVLIDEGKKFYIHNIRVRGNKKTNSSFIAHASSLKKGELMTQTKIQKAQGLINDSGLFSSVYVHPSALIDVKEQKFKSLRLRSGISSENTFSTGVSLDGGIKRFLSDDRSQIAFNTELKSNIRLIDYLSSIPNPPLDHFFEYRILGNYKKYYLFNTHWSGQTSYSVSKTIFSFPHNKEQSQSPSLSREGLTWAWSQKFNFNLEKKLNLQTVFNFKVLEMELIKSYTFPAINSSDQKDLWVNTTGFSFFLDRKDHIFFPKKGYFFSTYLDYSSPFLGSHPSIHFLKTEAKYKFYIPLISDKIIFAQSLGGGRIQVIPSYGVPYKHLFILEGPGDLRGFGGRTDEDRVPAQIEFPIKDPNDILYKSSYFYLSKSEIRFPLLNNIIDGALFYDRGGVFIKDYTFRHPRHSAGISFHLITPLGPFVISVACKIEDLQKIIDEDKDKIRWKHFRESLRYDFSVGVF